MISNVDIKVKNNCSTGGNEAVASSYVQLWALAQRFPLCEHSELDLNEIIISGTKGEKIIDV